MNTWHAYIAGFFDGEGSVSIARVRANGLSDYHKIVVHIGQRAKHRDVLDRICAEFGGGVFVHNQKTRLSGRWAEQASWQLQSKPEMRRFFEAIRPYVVIKAPQVDLGLEFVATFQAAGRLRDKLGRVRARILPVAEIERREHLRLAMRDLNALGPPRTKPSILPPLDVQHRQPTADPAPDFATVERGTQRYNARLTDDVVRAIRAEYAAGGVTQAALALKHGVSLMLINGVVRGTRWSHVT